MKKWSIVCCILLYIFCTSACTNGIEPYNNSINSIEQTETEESIGLENDLCEEELDKSLHSNSNLDNGTMINSGDQSDDIEKETTEMLQPPTDTSEENEEMSSKYTLIVDGKNIAYSDYMYFCENPRYVGLPFTAVMEGLGAVVEQKNGGINHIIFNGETYVLDMAVVTLVKFGSDTNYIIPAPGSKVYYQIVEDELVIDDITFRTIAMLMGIKPKIDVDYQNFSVEIKGQ